MTMCHQWVATHVPDLFSCSSCKYWRYLADKSVQADYDHNDTIRLFQSDALERHWNGRKSSANGYVYAWPKFVDISDGKFLGNWILDHPVCSIRRGYLGL